MPFNSPLGDFYSNLNKLGTTGAPPSVSVDFSSFNGENFKEIMKNIDKMSDIDVFNTTKVYINYVIEQTLNDDKTMGAILCHPKFVRSYQALMMSLPLTLELRLFANKLTYDYQILDGHDTNILEVFKSVSRHVNMSIVDSLCALNIPRVIADDLCVCRYSSRHENTNVRRLNFCMCRYNAEIFTDQMIIHVYEKLFDHVLELFISTMLEVYSNSEMDDLGNEFRDIYGNISLAILAILNNMSSLQIRQIILTYMDRYQSWYEKTHELPRFTLRALSYDYARIVNIVDKLMDEGYYVP